MVFIFKFSRGLRLLWRNIRYLLSEFESLFIVYLNYLYYFCKFTEANTCIFLELLHQGGFIVYFVRFTSKFKYRLRKEKGWKIIGREDVSSVGLCSCWFQQCLHKQLQMMFMPVGIRPGMIVWKGLISRLHSSICIVIRLKRSGQSLWELLILEQIQSVWH